jgi:hypothetical protein
VSVTRAELQRRLAAEFGLRGWEYDLSVGPAVVEELFRRGVVDAVALAAVVPGDYRRRLLASTNDVADAIARAFSGIVLEGEPAAPGMRVLFVAAGPEDEVRLRLDAEHREIRNRIRASSARDQISVEFAGATRPTDLIDELNRTRPTILHLAGHGGVTGIALEDDRGMATDVSTDQLTRLIGTAEDSLRLVVMNTCESTHQAQPMTATVDAAIGMTRSIGDDAARTFAAQLYASLGEGVSLDRAFEQARLQISLAGLPEDTTPALFLRSGVDARNLVFIA